MLSSDRDEHRKVRDKRILVSESLCLFFAEVSMGGCDLAGEVEGSGRVGTLCCRSRTRNGSLPLGFWVTKQSPRHLDLQNPHNTVDSLRIGREIIFLRFTFEFRVFVTYLAFRGDFASSSLAPLVVVPSDYQKKLHWLLQKR